MFKNKAFLVILALILCVLVYSWFHTSGSTGLSHSQEVQKYRNQMNSDIVSQENSPILNPSTFKGLNYYAPDSSWVVDADFTEEASGQSIRMTNGSQSTENPKVGYISFVLKGKTFKLSVFDEGEKFFIPFRDATNARDTYGGGRYLSVKKELLRGGKLKVDFNYAYNPYCAYNYTYVCPVPPTENTLSMAVSVGEKLLEPTP